MLAHFNICQESCPLFTIFSCHTGLMGANQLFRNNKFKWTKTCKFYVLNWFSINRFLKFIMLIAVSQSVDSLKGAEHQEILGQAFWFIRFF